jgi:hypothetical protein
MDLRKQDGVVTPSEIVNFDQDTPTTGGVVFDPNTPATTDILYVSSTNASTWIYNGSSYVTYDVPKVQSTPFFLYGTDIDAGGNKTAFIQRNGPILINSGSANGSRYAGYIYSRAISGAGNGLVVKKDLRTTSGNYLLIQGQNFSTGTTEDKFKVDHDGKTSSYGTHQPNVQSVVSAATVTPNADTDDGVVITAQAEALTIANPSGTPGNGQALIIRLKDNGTARTITFGSEYRAIGITLPTDTTISKTLYLGCIYNSTDSKWDVLGVNLEA